MYLHTPAVISTQPLIVYAANLRSACPDLSWDKQYVRLKKGMAQKGLQTLNGITVENTCRLFCRIFSR